jgi:hypothetical protein
MSVPPMTFENHLAPYKYYASGWKQLNLTTLGYGRFGMTKNIHNSSNQAQPDTRYDDEIKC